MDPVSLLAFKVFAMLAVLAFALQQNPPAQLRFYYHAQWIATALAGATLLLVPYKSSIYSASYTFLTVLVLFACLKLTLYSGWAHDHWEMLFILGGTVAAAVAWASISSTVPPNDWNGWIHVLEGSCLLGMGIVIGLAAPFTTPGERLVCYTLGLSWIAHGSFRLLYRLHWNIPAWRTANTILPWLIVFATVAFIGWKAHVSKGIVS